MKNRLRRHTIERVRTVKSSEQRAGATQERVKSPVAFAGVEFRCAECGVMNTDDRLVGVPGLEVYATVNGSGGEESSEETILGLAFCRDHDARWIVDQEVDRPLRTQPAMFAVNQSANSHGERLSPRMRMICGMTSRGWPSSSNWKPGK